MPINGTEIPNEENAVTALIAYTDGSIEMTDAGKHEIVPEASMLIAACFVLLSNEDEDFLEILRESIRQFGAEPLHLS